MGLALAYERLMRHRDDEERMQIDADLGMPGAREELDKRRMTTVGEFGIEVG